MTKRTLTIVATAVLVATASLDAATSRIVYERALERETAVRTRLAVSSPPAGAVAEARRVIAAYERLVRRYRGSGYADNAYWQAGSLAADLWSRTGADDDRDTARRLLKLLVDGYPSSSLVPRARAALKRLADDDADTPTTPALVARETARKPTRAAAHTEPADDERVIPVPEPSRVKVRDILPAPPLPAAVATTGNNASIVGITRTVANGLVRVVIELDREVAYHDDRISNPDRVFIDLAGVHLGQALKRSQRFDDGVVRQIRVGTRPEGAARVVLEVDGTSSHSVFTLYNPYRVVVDCERPGPITAPVAAFPVARSAAMASVPTGTSTPTRQLEAGWAAQRAAAERIERARKPAPATARVSATESPAVTGTPAPLAPPVPLPPASRTRIEREPLQARAPADAPSATAPVTPLTPPSANLAGRFSLSRQLGLGISRIVIDPGHGGHDPGAQVKGLHEAELVLDVALRLKQLLVAEPGVEVVMTRDTDVFIPLEERTAIANREGADLFLSIHANASRNGKARGIETYFLNFASNRDAEAVAARENAASERTMHSLPDIVKAITLNDKLDESRDFATLVQRAMIDQLRNRNRSLRDLGVKQAPFVVLIGAVMPSVLAEISFVTNPQEGKLLKTPAYRQQIAEALFEGVARYQRSLKAVPTVANQ